MQFFKHDTDMISDNKIQQLIISCGSVAYGIYCLAVEKIGNAVDEKNIDCALPMAAKIIAHDLWEDESKVVSVLEKAIDLGLLEGDAKGTIYCKKILTRLNTGDVSNQQLRSAINKAKKEQKTLESGKTVSNGNLDENQAEIKENIDNRQENIKKNLDENLTNIKKSSEICQENIKTDIDKDTDIEIDKDRDTDKDVEHLARTENLDSENSFVPETLVPNGTTYAQKVFDILKSNDLPCCRGNFLTFIQRDFKIALEGIHELKLTPDEVFSALENYVKVIELKRQGLSWWESELTFFNLCSGRSKTILRFLPENFNLDNYRKSRDSPGSLPDDRIRLDVEGD